MLAENNDCKCKYTNNSIFSAQSKVNFGLADNKYIYIINIINISAERTHGHSLSNQGHRLMSLFRQGLQSMLSDAFKS